MKSFLSLADQMETPAPASLRSFENNIISKEALAAVDPRPPRPFLHSDHSFPDAVISSKGVTDVFQTLP